MDAMVEIEQASEAGQNLAQVVGRFSVWRASRKAGGRIPAELWAAAVAVDMAKLGGLYRMSKVQRGGARVAAVDQVALHQRLINPAELLGDLAPPLGPQQWLDCLHPRTLKKTDINPEEDASMTSI